MFAREMRNRADVWEQNVHNSDTYFYNRLK